MKDTLQGVFHVKTFTAIILLQINQNKDKEYDEDKNLYPKTP